MENCHQIQRILPQDIPIICSEKLGDYFCPPSTTTTNISQNRFRRLLPRSKAQSTRQSHPAFIAMPICFKAEANHRTRFCSVLFRCVSHLAHDDSCAGWLLSHRHTHTSHQGHAIPSRQSTCFMVNLLSPIPSCNNRHSILYSPEIDAFPLASSFTPFCGNGCVQVETT